MTADFILPPALILIFGAFLLPLVQGWLRSTIVVALPLITLWQIWLVPDGVAFTVPFLDYMLEPVEGDKLSRVFGTIFALAAFGGGLFALKQSRILELAAAFAYAGSAIGVTFAGDLITMFIYWEIMAIGSTIVIWSASTEESRKAAFRYLQIHLLGGVLLLIGVVGYISQTGSANFEAMTLGTLPTWFMLAGILINAGAPPLSAWVADAYPEASWSGTVFLSAFTTKTAVYVLIRGYPGTELLIWIGLFMVLYGAIYALMENDIRRILVYSIVNQVGFMVVAVGIGTDLALNGATAHAFAHILYKALLLMSAGSVLYMTGGVRKCTNLGGLFQSMPLTAICGIIGALAISAFPLTAGFISKSMISQSAADGGMALAWTVLTAASAGAILYAGFKYPWFVFFAKDSGLRPKDPPLPMRAAMVIFAFLCIALGIYPDPLYAALPFPVEYVPYTAEHVIKKLQLLLFAGLAFFVLLRFMKLTDSITLDFDWFYRVLGKKAAGKLVAGGQQTFQHFEKHALQRIGAFISIVFRHHGPNGVLARTQTAGTMIAIALLLLVIYIVLYFN